MTDLAFLWHMHQPDYRDESGVMGMPWVFLHAIKDYVDMPWYLSRYPKLKATFNLTPPLIEQILLLEEKGISADRFLSLWVKPPESLSNPEKEWVVKICRSSQFPTMVKPLHRYAELYQHKSYDDTELLELETLFLLAWCGNYLREKDPIVRSLLDKGKSYDQRDKESLLDALMTFIPTVLPYYRERMEAGQIALSTTPLNHPILPLLIDMENARISNPNTVIPEHPLSLEKDAELQVEKALELYRETFGRAPVGFWPAEGAVDRRSLSLYSERGLRWVATDEAILFASLESSERSALYRRHNVDGVQIAFRDHTLSDLIGFTYRYREAEEAADDFLGHLEKIERSYKNAAVSVILDGENAWEFYPDNGKPFFDALYRKLRENASWCRTLTLDEAAEKPSSPLPKLHPGSWIHGTFDTWVGHPQKNAAWEMIYQTKRDIEHHEKSLNPATREKIRYHFLAAECSDWFWWYGDDHHTDYASEFDALFRKHLITIYTLAGLAVPAGLYLPIVSHQDHHALVDEPKFPITPIIDGRVSSFFEWLGAGRSDESRLYSTMDRVRGPIDTLYWGEDAGQIYLRLDGEMKQLDRSAVLHLYTEENRKEISIPLDGSPLPRKIRTAKKEILELALPKKLFGRLKKIHLRLELEIDGRIVQTLPGAGELSIDLEDDFSENWFV